MPCDNCTTLQWPPVGSFRRTAEMCQVDQSNVSRALKQLEANLGVALFERARSGVRLIPAGQRFLAEVSPALEQLESALQAEQADSEDAPAGQACVLGPGGRGSG